MRDLPRSATIVEVGLRDGLQNEKERVPTEGKLRLARALLAAGLRELEVTSFVRPDLVPQLADAEALVAALPRDEAAYIGLIGNLRGYERAAAAGLRDVIFVLAATDAFNEHNVRRPVAASLTDLRALCAQGSRDGVNVRAAIAVSFGCPYSGPVRPERVVEVALACADAGARDIEAADTIGTGTPRRSADVFAQLRAALPGARVGAHFHDTRGQGLANVWAAVQVGIDRFDTSIAGLGGCPFAPGATGNVATEDVAYLLEESGIATGLDREKLFAAVDVAESLVGRPSAGRVKQAERARVLARR